MKATKFSQYLQHREELQFVDRPHWIYVLEAGIWTTIIILAGFWCHNFISDRFIYPRMEMGQSLDSMILTVAAYTALFAKWGALVYAILFFLSRVIFYFSTFIFASDRRLYFKTGMVRVQVFEISFDEIQKTDINYGWLGRFLGYGKLMLDARFVEDEDLPFTHKPEIFGKLIHYNNDLNQDINLAMVTNEIKKGHARREKVLETSDARKQIDPMHDQMDTVHYDYPVERDAVERTQKKHEVELEEQIHNDFDEAIEKEEETGDFRRTAPADPNFLK